MERKAPRTLSTAADVTDGILRAAEEIYDGWFSRSERIDWESFIDRLCAWGVTDPEDPFDMDEYYNPAFNKIQRHIREYRKDG